MAQLMTEQPRLQATYSNRPIPRPDNSIRLGRWDPVSGTVVYGDGSTAQSGFRLTPKEEKKPEPKPQPKAPKPNPIPKERAPRIRQPKAPREKRPRAHYPNKQPTIEQVRLAISLYAEGQTTKEVSKETGLGYHLVGDLLNGAGVLKTTGGGRPKVSKKQADAIREAPGKQADIAKAHGITREEVNRIKRGRVFKPAPMDIPRTLEADLLAARLLKEFGQALWRLGRIPHGLTNRRMQVVDPALFAALQRYIWETHLVTPATRYGDTLGEVIDRTAEAILKARERTA